jgi:hypothetical protein
MTYRASEKEGLYSRQGAVSVHDRTSATWMQPLPTLHITLQIEFDSVGGKFGVSRLSRSRKCSRLDSREDYLREKVHCCDVI